jgi:hypothetical protein
MRLAEQAPQMWSANFAARGKCRFGQSRFNASTQEVTSSLVVIKHPNEN